MQQLTISSNWFAKRRSAGHELHADLATTDGWLPARVPGCIHLDLLAAQKIPDPFYGMNERDIQWVGESDWLYRCTFDVPAHWSSAQANELCFDGLDTFATVWLNGYQILESDNMFIPQRVRVEHVLRAGENELIILFKSALRSGKEREEQHGQLDCWNGDTSRLYVRKAQYHYGWDWGPSLITAGPWQPIRLESYEVRIIDLHCTPEIAADLSSAALPIQACIEFTGATRESELELELELFTPAGELLESAAIAVNGPQLWHTFNLSAPQLWWPRGYGEQPLYKLVASLRRIGVDSCNEDRQEQRLGLRRVRLVQEPLADQPGSSFLFEINNTPIFCGGANWIPADSFIPRIAAQRYRQLLQAAADANMAMLRVWGGGIYEEDIFYDICDELGLLVWQDFMFACGIYPAHDWFLASVHAEAAAALRRLRRHPCIVLWCGNNEDYSVAEAKQLYTPAYNGDFQRTGFPAREIYERLLPQLCLALDPTRPYWPGSPYGGGDPNAPTQGDRHTWEVWHGPQAHYQRYGEFFGRFVSEFGMQAAPAQATLEAVIPSEERYPESRAMDYHNKADDGPRRLAVYLNDSVRQPANLSEYIYATQLIQAEALAAAVRQWRRQWGGPGRYAVAGALVWQLNDCWPATSWAMIDYFLRPKPAYYTVRRELMPQVVGLLHSGREAELWVVNATAQALDAELQLSLWSLSGEPAGVEQRQIRLLANQTTELEPYALQEDGMVLHAQLAIAGEVVARATLWPEPFKYYRLLDPGIEISHLPGERLQLSAKRPAKGVLLTAADHVRWSDNMFDLIPNEARIIRAQGLAGGKIDIRWLR